MINASTHKLRSSAPELRAFSEGRETTREIAKRHGISPSALTARAKKAGLPLRKRGRWQLPEPTPKQKKILNMARTHTIAEVGARFGVTKQRVSQVVRRWTGWETTALGVRRKKRRRKARVISFRVDEASNKCLCELLKHAWFKNLRSTGGAARQIVHKFLADVFPEDRFLNFGVCS